MREPDAQPRVERSVPFREPPAPRPRAGDARPGYSALAPATTADWMTAQGEPAYRARQVADALWSGRAASFGEVRQLPAALRTRLAEAFRADTITDTQVRPADGGLTGKALHTLDDGRTVESVLMRYPARGERRARATVCISSQAGCAVGCPFCATGELGFWRDLDAAEIVDQARFWRHELVATDERVTNIVFMGMGEPLLNVDAVLDAAAALSDPRRFGLGARHLTISTSGVVPGIERLIVLRPQYTLAVSLHAARPALRALLVPLEHRWPAADVVAAATAYADVTGRRVTYEMVMIDGINDTPADAHAAADLLRGRLAHVNLIPMNPVAHTPWQPSAPARIEAFAGILQAAGLGTTIRGNRGVDIGAACGQLAAELAGQPTPAAVARRRKLLVDRSTAALQLATSVAHP
jgi:23S rRNA (adenine2503-C2)-methyltransferase